MMLLTAVVLSSLLAAPQKPAPTEILWDTWGVPHIYARHGPRSLPGLRLRPDAEPRQPDPEAVRPGAWPCRGVLGARPTSPRIVSSGPWASRPGRRQWYGQQDPVFRGLLDAFAVGINQYAREHPEALADSVRQVLPVTAVDVLAHTQRVIHCDLRGGRGSGPGGPARWRHRLEHVGDRAEAVGQRSRDAAGESAPALERLLPLLRGAGGHSRVEPLRGYAGRDSPHPPSRSTTSSAGPTR